MSSLARFRPPPPVRLVVGALALGVLAYLVDVRAVVGRLSGLDAGWVAGALGVTVVQTLLSAWRWRYTAGRLGLDLPLADALGEYYRGVFVNQVLPGGVVGDASRAWRHASRTRDEWGAAVRAVVLERASGQVAMTFLAAVSFVILAPRVGTDGFWRVGAIFAAVVVVAVVVWLVGGRARGTAVGTFLRDARAALVRGQALAVQSATSLLIVGSYVVTYLFAARAVGVTTPFAELAPLVPPVLLAMLVPLSVGGWGLREGAAAGLWVAVGLGAAEGVAISVAYGVTVLLGTLPGAYLLAFGGMASGGSEHDAAGGGVSSSARSKRMSSPSTK